MGLGFRIYGAVLAQQGCDFGCHIMWNPSICLIFHFAFRSIFHHRGCQSVLEGARASCPTSAGCRKHRRSFSIKLPHSDIGETAAMDHLTVLLGMSSN